jgi:Rrf2 family iron-sulfur cluster assembly transcriptional regulator
VRGPGGGYQLARDASKVTVADIISAVGEPLDSTQCGGRENCLENQRCMTHDLWEELNTTVYGSFRACRSRQLVAEATTRPVSLVRNARSRDTPSRIRVTP